MAFFDDFIQSNDSASASSGFSKTNYFVFTKALVKVMNKRSQIQLNKFR